MAVARLFPPGFALSGKVLTIVENVDRVQLIARYGFNTMGTRQHLHLTETSENVTTWELVNQPNPNTIELYEVVEEE